jgi:hypothetical protein
MRADDTGEELEDSGLTIFDDVAVATSILKSNQYNLMMLDGQSLNRMDLGYGASNRDMQLSSMQSVRVEFGADAPTGSAFGTESPYGVDYLWDLKLALSIKVRSNSSGNITDTYLDIPSAMSIRANNGQSRLTISNAGAVGLPTHNNSRNENDRAVTSSAFNETDFQFNAVRAGVVPMSGGGTTNFLRADGNWATPSGGGTAKKSYNVQYGSSGALTTNAILPPDVGNWTNPLGQAISNGYSIVGMRVLLETVTTQNTTSSIVFSIRSIEFNECFAFRLVLRGKFIRYFNPHDIFYRHTRGQ